MQQSTTDKKNNQSSYDNIKENGYIALKKESMASYQKSTITKAVQVW